MIPTVVVGYGLAAQSFHCPLIARQSALSLRGIVARNPEVREDAETSWNVRGYADLDEVLADPEIRLVVIATPHDTHAEMAIKVLDAGKDCVVDKVMALSTEEADRMIEARDRSGRMLSVFHNRRWDWDYATLKDLLRKGMLGRPLLFDSSVCRYAAPRNWRGSLKSAGSILHDWGAHLIDQALQLDLGPCRRVTSRILDAPWPGVDSGGYGLIVLEFDGDILFQIETSRISRIEKPRWYVVGTDGSFLKYGLDPQEEALRSGDLLRARESDKAVGLLRRTQPEGDLVDSRVPSIRASWDSYYANISAHLRDGAPLLVTAEEARDVVRVLDAAMESARDHSVVSGHWGLDHPR
jgi:scyllo-inositol 2-dehydrogenase (NADP+)